LTQGEESICNTMPIFSSRPKSSAAAWKTQMTKSSARAAIRLLITSFFITYLVSEILFPANMAFA
jgi:hypothetical protein